VSLIAVVETPISVEEVSRAVEHEGAGAVVTFAGTVRRTSQGHTIHYLEYSAYKPMAEREMRKIADEVQTRWGLPCAIVHRVGRLEIGEASVVIAVASPHRGAAFEACHWAIDRIKETVPVWKKEVAVDGYWWVEDPLTGPGAGSSSSST
jgi:molybdopterin synthase catalytic subunit